MGYDSLYKLSTANPHDILELGSRLSGSSCWKNSWQARAAVTNATISAARYVNDKGKKAVPLTFEIHLLTEEDFNGTFSVAE